ncbi:MAG: 30S ribosomal protein S5 [Candidatus Saccharimonadales bacterium]
MAEASNNPTQAPATKAVAATSYSSENNRSAGRRRGPGPRGPVEEKQFDERIVNIDRVARVVKGGRRFRFRALVVAGDHKGKIGIGIAKGADVTAAVTKATEVAKKRMVIVKLYKGTLPHSAEGKIGGSHILIKPASAGTGLIAGGVVRTILEVAGVSNVLSKSLGSANKANTAYATIAALESLVSSKDWVTTKQTASKSKSNSKTETNKPVEAPVAKEVKK